MSGPIKGHICPEYYWVQVQLQLECCNLEECDFWQCDIGEYKNKDEFLQDTDPNEPFRSIETGFEKGCLIQLIPKDKIGDAVLNGSNYFKTIHDHATFIYPPKIEMTPYECDLWIAETVSKMSTDSKYFNSIFDKVIYWRLNKSNNVKIDRDRKWFAENIGKFEQMWNYVTYFRNNQDKLNMLIDYIDNRPNGRTTIKKEDEIMNVVDKIYNKQDKNYDTTINNIKNTIKKWTTQKSLRQQPSRKLIKDKKNSKINTFNKNYNQDTSFDDGMYLFR